MDNSGHDRSLCLLVRLEDAIAFAFFCVVLILLVSSGVQGLRQSGPATQMALLGVVALLVKELLQQALSRRQYRPGELRKFVRPYAGILRDWFPFVVILMMYYSLFGDATHLLVSHDRDAALMGLDQRLFGFQASIALQRWITPALTSWMKFSYSMHLLYIPIVAGFLYARRPRRQFREMMCGLVVICFFGFLGYLLVPAVGPGVALKSMYTVPLSSSPSVIEWQARLMESARIQRDAFPSMHVGISFLIWIYGGRNSRRLFFLLSPLILSLWVSTLYLRYHYMVDCLAGLALASACFFLANWLVGRFGEFRLLFRVPAFVAEWLGPRDARTPASEPAADS
jgi:membrane-associated phospholipid phosphatase